MITLAVFNDKGGVGRTTLVYHLAHMLSRLGRRILAVDLDPQSDLTSLFLDEDSLEVLWRDDGKMPSGIFSDERKIVPSIDIPDGAGTIADSVRPLLERTGDVQFVSPIGITDMLSFIPGSLALNNFESELSARWSEGFSGNSGALRVTSAFHRIIKDAGSKADADLVIIDVGANLGAINRAALLASDKVMIPLAVDLFSLRGLSNLGPRLREWREQWQKRVLPTAPRQIDLPNGMMEPIGYVIMQSAMRLNRPVRAYSRYLQQIPVVYAYAVLGQGETAPVDRSHEIAVLRNYQSLMPLAHDARKPMFDLKPSDGAIGATGDFVRRCYEDFEALALDVTTRLGLLAQAPRISARSKLTGSSSCENVHDRGVRSGRHRTNCAVCRNRGPSMWS
jgi:cellulose biosynthesis protein BcsQ